MLGRKIIRTFRRGRLVMCKCTHYSNRHYNTPKDNMSCSQCKCEHFTPKEGDNKYKPNFNKHHDDP